MKYIFYTYTYSQTCLNILVRLSGTWESVYFPHCGFPLEAVGSQIRFNVNKDECSNVQSDVIHFQSATVIVKILFDVEPNSLRFNFSHQS